MIIREGRPRAIFITVVGAMAVAALIYAGRWWGVDLMGPGQGGILPIPGGGATDASRTAQPPHPLFEVLKLIAAAVIGIFVGEVYRRSQSDRPVNRSFEQAQVLLCVAGAMMMIIIGDSFARAIGVWGGASIIRFRTPVDDPKDAVILFLLLGLGMSCGLGAFAVAGLGTIFLCLFLLFLENVGVSKPRTMMLTLVAGDADFPSGFVRDVFARSSVASWEPREVVKGPKTSMKYFVTLEQFASLSALNAELTKEGSGIHSVSWEVPKRSE